MANKKRNFRQENLGLDIYQLDGYRVVYEDTKKNGGKTITRLLDENGNVMLMLLSNINNPNVFAYTEMARLYLEPNNNDKLEIIKKLFDKGLKRKEIAQELNMSVSTVGDYFRYYDLKHKKGFTKEERKGSPENFGFNLSLLDGYKVVYEETVSETYRYIARLIDENGRVLSVSKTSSSNKIISYLRLAQAYILPNEDTQIKLDAIRKLYSSGMNKINIAKSLNITKQSLNSYFYYYNIDNRVDLEKGE